MEPLETRVQSVFRRVLDQGELVLRRDMTALDVSGWDSLSHIQIIVALEKEFRVKLKASEVISLRNAGEMIDLVRSKL